MKGRWFLAFLLTALAGSALHFAYDLCPSPLVGLFCPVSESVWEHLKLLYAPFLVCGFVLNRKAADTQAAWSGTLAALLAMPAFLLGVYYTLESGFSFTAGWLNITLYVLTLALGFRLSAKLCRTGQLVVAVRRAGDCGGALWRGADSVYDGAPGAADFPGLSEKTCRFRKICIDIQLFCHYNSWRKQRRSGKRRTHLKLCEEVDTENVPSRGFLCAGACRHPHFAFGGAFPSVN